MRTTVMRSAWYTCIMFSIFFCQCGERDEIVRSKLDIILAGDLKEITKGIAKNDLLQTPYYTMASYKSYSQGMYSKLAVVDFYFLKGIRAKIVRKYRYLSSARLWDRYYNVYTFYGDTALSAPR